MMEKLSKVIMEYSTLQLLDVNIRESVEKMQKTPVIAQAWPQYRPHSSWTLIS